MPEISRFFGIIIRMYYDEHLPPHFHALYGGAEGQVGIDPIGILTGNLPSRVVSMAIEWAALHQNELKENWELVRAGKSPHKLPPLR